MRKIATASATIRLAFTSKRQLQAINRALLPEVRHQPRQRGTVVLQMKGKNLRLRFEGTDTATLRAVVTSYLRLVAASLRAVNQITRIRSWSISSQKQKNDC